MEHALQQAPKVSPLKRKPCATSNCRGKAIRRSRFCAKCRHRQTKARTPWRYCYQYHRSNALRRLSGRVVNPWALSFEQFMAIWNREPEKKADKEKSLRGIKATSTWEIDRIDPERGYEPENVRLVTKLTNVRFQWDYQHGKTFVIECIKLPQDERSQEQAPF